MTTNGFNTSFGAQPQGSLGSTLVGDRKGASEYKKIFCAYHTTQFLTNFCIQKECLMPLCPTCVVEHTEQHYQFGQKPTYVNLHDSLQDSKQKCYSSIVQLEELARKNDELHNYVRGLPDYINQQLFDCKKKIYSLIDERFQEFEKQLVSQVRQKYSEEGVYNRKECDQIKDYISSQIESLYQKISQLKGDQCLAALIRFYESQESGFQHDLDEITQYIERNQRAGGIYISLNQEAIEQQIGDLCQRVVELQYIGPDNTRSLNSTLRSDSHLKSSHKKPSSSVVNRLAASRSGHKDRTVAKGSSQVVSGKKSHERGMFNSPFTPAQP